MNNIQKIKKEIDKLQKQITTIQSECNHPKSARIVKHKGSTGGYERDSYWEEHTCGLCEKFWVVDID